MRIGKDSHIAETARIKQTEYLIMGNHSRISDYALISPKTTLGNYCLIERFCIIGGSKYNFVMEDFSGFAPRVTVWCQSNDYVNNIVGAGSQIVGDVIFRKYTGVGTSTVIMPNNIIPEGTVIGANSFVPTNFPFKPWSVYAGNPIHFIKNRNRESVLAESEKYQKIEEI